MFGKRKLKKEIEKLKRQHGVLVSQNKTLKNENKIFENNLDQWETLTNYVSKINFKSDAVTMPDRIIEILKSYDK